MKNLIFLAFLFNATLAFSQNKEPLDCGTEINSSNFDRLSELNTLWLGSKNNVASRSNVCSTIFIPVQIHIIRQTAATGGISASATNKAFKLLNEYYYSANIHFYQCATINYIDNSTYYNYNKTQANALYNAYKVNNVLNIFIANTVSNSSGGSICGHAYFPGGIDFVMQSASCMQNGSTLAHEVGHYFGLYHTHESQFGNEAVNGSDCSTQGDLMCDTPADPTLSKSSNVNRAGCIYYGTNTDEDGSQYTPSVTNIMSYSAKECRYDFTQEQKAKILWVAQNQRAYLSCTTPPLAANFYYNEEENCATSKLFSFYNASEGAVSSYAWNFGDGTGTSSLESPTYSYAQKGIYTVRLIVSNGSSNDTLEQMLAVGAVSVPYSNDFEIGAASLNAFVLNNAFKNNARVHTSAAKSSTYGLVFDGTETSSTSPFFQTPTAAVSFENLWNPHFKSEVKLCVDATNTSNLTLEFDKRQVRTSNDNYTNFRISVNGITQGNVYQVNNSNSDDGSFTHITVDLSAFDGQLINIGFEGSHKYHKNRNSTNGGSATFIDNINITGNSVLPIELIDFTATPIRETVKLDWKTLTETNNDFFTIEKSLDGFHWEKVTQIKGSGNSIDTKIYAAVDEKPYLNTSYYRLKQTDFNGNYSYSLIRTVNLKPSVFSKIYPNPAKDQVTLETNKSELESLSVYNILGQNITNKLSFHSVNNDKTIIDLTPLNQGIYYIHTKNSTHKISKQ